MAEKKARQSQYEYKATASLVLQADRSMITKISRDEATGEVLTLRERIKGEEMGSKFQRAIPPDTIRKKQISKKVEKTKSEKDKTNSNNFVGLFYKPSTKETKQVYEVLLSFVQNYTEDVPRDVLYNATDEVLAYLKDDSLKDSEKKKEVEGILNFMNDEKYYQLNTLAKKITDYTTDKEANEENVVDENVGVSIVFEEEEKESVKSSEEEDDDGEETMVTDALSGNQTSEQLDFSGLGDQLDPRLIDAYWLQRQLSKYYDALTSQKKSLEVLEIMESSQDDREIENKLVFSLGYENFDFIRTLRSNRLLIVYCTKLAKVGTDEERKEIENQMKSIPELSEALFVLKGGDDGSTARAANLRKSESRKARIDKELDIMDVEMDGTHGKTIIDFETILFQEGGHFMASKRCDLPEGTRREDKKGYQEIHIPSIKAQSKGKESFVKISEMPEFAHLAFSKYKHLNRIQSKLYQPCMHSDENLLVCAPTGAGKTNIAMMCMLRELGKHQLKNSKFDLNSFKIVYVSPMKSLVAEQIGSFSLRLRDYGIKVNELTGDHQLTKEQIDETQIIFCTPEKWDIVTRKGGDRTFTNLVRLLIIDEIHLLHDERGPVIESIVSRTLRNTETTQLSTRILGLSATLPNYEDVADFLMVDHKHGLFFFDNSYRPVPLEQHFIGVTEKKAIKRMKIMDEIVYEKVLNHAGKEQILIFVHSRKDTAKTARKLRDLALDKDTLGYFMKEGSASHAVLRLATDETTNGELKDLLPYGFGIHHAGMSRIDRTAIEDLFADGHIQVLVSTATLAWGVNLPAHTVIIKGTQVYNPAKGSWVELSHLDVLQMLGRAGRPQYDSVGEGYLITSHQELYYYLSLQNVQLPVESQLISKLVDTLNAEIALGTVQNCRDGQKWLTSTFLYIRMIRSPQTYGISHSELENDPSLIQKRADLIHTAATILDKNNLIKYERRTGGFQGTDLGRISSHYYIAYSTIATYNLLLKPTLNEIDLFRIFSLSGEFKQITVREEEKIELSALLERVPIPIKESIEEPSAKVNVLLQAYISQLGLEGFALRSDMVYITQSASRLFRAIFEISLQRGWAQVAIKCLNICKMIDKRMWLSMTPLRQFKKIPIDVIKHIEKIEDFPFERFYDMTPVILGNHVRVPKIGQRLYECVHSLPKLDLEAHIQPITSNTLRVELTLTPDFKWDKEVHGHSQSFWIFVEDVDSEIILHLDFLVLKSKYCEDDHTLNFYIPIFDPLPPQYFIRIVSDRWITIETIKPISFRHLILPDKAFPPTSLLDLQPLPFSALQNKAFEQLYTQYDYMNSIQTQVFSSLYSSSDNVLIGAPTGSGKTLCAEFAILHMLSTQPDGRCVYIAPIPALATQRFNDWQQKFSLLNSSVVILTGDTTVDLKLLAKAKIVVSTPENWDILSRRWKQRKNIINTTLFICDELHLLGGSSGPVIEIIVSRMRYIENQTEQKIRIIGLSSSLAYAKDIASWIGAPSHSVFNFHPSVRPIPLEIHFQGFNIVHSVHRLSVMSKPLYSQILKHSFKQPVIVFTPSRKQAHLTAVELMGFCVEDSRPKQFLHCSDSELQVSLQVFRDDTIKETLESGIAYYHEGLNENEKSVIHSLFSTNSIQILVCSRDVCWELNLLSHLVVVMDTQYYDGRDHRYIDYSILDMLQMLGMANKAEADQSSKALIMCQTSKKELYKKFLQELLPVESHLNHCLHDHFVAEIVTQIIENKQDAVDYLTWTYLYRRLSKNANYYNMTGVTNRHISDYLSELVESTLQDLEESHCISIEDEMDVSPLNLGMIASYYYIQYTTIEVFSMSLTEKTKIKGMLEIIAHAAEFSKIPIRHREDRLLQQLALRCPIQLSNPKYNDPHVKTLLLLQAHFSRIQLSSDMQTDLETILKDVIRLIQACVDVLSSNGWLRPALAAMDISQMAVQALWDNDLHIKQIPHFTRELSERSKLQGINSIYDLMEMEDNSRKELLNMDESLLKDVAAFCNRYPSIDVSYEIPNAKTIFPGDTIVVNVQLDRDDDEETPLEPVNAPFYPTRKDESWWCVIGNKDQNVLYSIKRIPLQLHGQLKLEFTAPAEGNYKYKLYIVCDSYIGADQEYDIHFQVLSKQNVS